MTIYMFSCFWVCDNFMIYNLEIIKYFIWNPFVGYCTFNGAFVLTNIVTLFHFVVRERHCYYLRIDIISFSHLLIQLLFFLLI